jgi:[ribosomal protein S5]-alanine N-acetyltransferase
MRLGRPDPGGTAPTLHTDRLVLRLHTLADAPELARLAGTREVAATTLRIPHPYSVADAEAYIIARQDVDEQLAFAIVLRENSVLLGGIGLRLEEKEHRHAELGYWIGAPYWGQGYATEASRAMLRYGFEVLNLHRIHASHFANNAASGNVLRKIGMKHEGTLRQHILKWGQYVDLEVYGMLDTDLLLSS